MLIILITCSGIAIVLGLFYLALRTKTKNVSSQSPYKEIINREVSLKRDCILAKNIDAFVMETPYFLEEQNTPLFEGVTVYQTLKKGTVLHIDKAKHFTNGTSGVTHSVIFGSLNIPQTNEKVDFEYYWGEQHTDLYNNQNSYWTFPLALWQETKDSNQYKLPQ